MTKDTVSDFGRLFVPLGLVLLLLATACVSQPAADASAAVNFEGLADVKRPRFDVAQVRPGVDFSRYNGVILAAPELAFRTPDRATRQFALDDAQKQRFQSALAQAFSEEFQQLSNLELRDQAGPTVLMLSVRVENIAATVPAGKGRQLGFALEAVGEATLLLELYDSESGEILARGADTRVLAGAAAGQGAEMLTRWEGVDELCARWASMARARLDALVDPR